MFKTLPHIVGLGVHRLPLAPPGPSDLRLFELTHSPVRFCKASRNLFQSHFEEGLRTEVLYVRELKEL